MKLLHTSDWHLGHSMGLGNISRDYEHRRFLSWLLDTIDENTVDALLICGDIFDTANPSSEAQSLWYGFLADARCRFPQLDIVVIGGNHDSPGRLDAPNPLLSALKIHIVGGARKGGTSRGPEEFLFDLTDKDNRPAVKVAGVPFLRTGDLPKCDHSDPLIGGVQLFYKKIIKAATDQLLPNQALVATGHCYLTGTTLSELSERRILGGNQHALPVDIFDDEISYAALGHLHLHQQVGAPHIRYSGSPIPLSMGERHYKHEITLVEFNGEKIESIQPILVPRSVDFIRIPSAGHVPLEKLLPMLTEIDNEKGDNTPPPYLEVGILLEKPEPSLRSQIEGALEGKHVHLIKISAVRSGGHLGLPSTVSNQHLQDMDVESVFQKKYETLYDDAPPKTMMNLFHELLESVQQGDDH